MKVNRKEAIWCLGICLAAAAAGSVFTSTGVGSWYLSLNKPMFNPPNWIFGPVWTVLYVLMGISLYLVRTNPPAKNNPHRAEQLFAVQLFLNVLWSAIFFGLRNPLAALLEIILLWGAILLTWQKFKEISKTAADLLVPYLAWVSFAGILNLAIVILN